MRPRDYYDHLIADLPVGADRTILRILSFHIGLKCAISRPQFLAECSLHGTTFTSERQLRLTIVKLRKAGVPICASSGEGGYYLPESFAEYEEFRNREYIKKFLDMKETADAMDGAIQTLFPTVSFGNDQAIQTSLF